MSDQSAALEIRAEGALVSDPLLLAFDAVLKDGVTVENMAVIERMMALRERQQDRDAEQQFARAFAAMQAETASFQATKIVPDKTGHVRYRFTPFEDIMREVRPLMEKHGFSVSFSTDFADGRIIQTCTLQHVAGYHRDYKSFVRAGAGPYGATETQADGAAMTYAKRYALCNALSIVIEHDSDGVPHDVKNEGGPITDEQAQTLREMVKDTGSDEVKFLAFCGAKTFETIGSGRYKEAFAALQRKRQA